MEIIKLKHPVDFEGGKLTELSLRRSKVSDISRANELGKNDIAVSIELTAMLAGLPKSIIEELDGSDYRRAQETIAGFLE